MVLKQRFMARLKILIEQRPRGWQVGLLNVMVILCAPEFRTPQRSPARPRK